MRRAVLAVLLILTGCGTPPEPKIVTQTVKVEVPVPCKPDLGQRPALMTKDQINAALVAAPNFDERVRLLTDQLLLYMGWMPQVEAAVKGCSQVPASEGAPAQ